MRPFTPHTFGRYELVHRLAAGGMAEVYVAVLRGAAGFSKRVALKRVLPFFGEDPSFVSMFQDEARMASTLTHANVAQVFEFGEVDGSFYLTMELVEGLDLARVNERLAEARQPMPLPTAAFIIGEAARGLSYAHERKGDDGVPLGLVHRDVSPQNILLSVSGDVKITDFGIAKAAGKSHKTATGVVMGKLRYMSPEQIGGRELDGKSDVFSLGVVLYELVTAGPIFPGEDSVRLAELIHVGDIPPPSTRQPAVPPELDRLILAALDRDTARRPTASALARELSMFVSQHAPGFTREDLAELVNSVFRPEDDHTRRQGNGSGQTAFLPTEAGTPRLSAPPPDGSEPAWVTGSRGVAPAQATSGAQGIANARAEERTPTGWKADGAPPRALDVPTRTRYTDTPVKPADELEPPAPRRARPELWVGGVLAGVILISGGFVGWRLLGGSSARSRPDAAVAPPPDGATAIAKRPDARVAQRPDAAPAGTVPPPIDDRAKAALAAAVGKERVTRRGVAGSADYRAFVSALDYHVARLVVTDAGKLERGATLPPALADDVARTGVGAAVDATIAYVRAVGTLPPDVAAALGALRRQAGAIRRGAEGYTAGALGALIDAGDADALAANVQAMTVLGGSCTDAASPRPWHAELCDPEAARAALERVAPGHAAIAPLARWIEAAPLGAITISWSSELAGTTTVLEVGAAPGDVTVVAGGLAGPIAPAADPAAPDGGARRLTFRLPATAWAPVLVVKGEAEQLFRVPPRGAL